MCQTKFVARQSTYSILFNSIPKNKYLGGFILFLGLVFCNSWYSVTVGTLEDL